MNQYVIKLSPRVHTWMKDQDPVVQRVLGNLIAAHFTQRETSYITQDDILNFFCQITCGSPLVPACKELDRLFKYGHVGYVS